MAAISVNAAIALVEMPLTLSMTSSDTANVAIRSDSATALVMAFCTSRALMAIRMPASKVTTSDIVMMVPTDALTFFEA